jgi:prepilin-type N-terminal cleavage/methylation domain-containing protein
VAFVATFATLGILALTDSRELQANEWPRVVAAMFCAALIPAVLGFFAGSEGARSSTPPRAFLRGLVFFGCAVGVCGGIAYLILRNESVDSFRALVTAVVFWSLVTCTASLVSGVAAIYVRDYRQFQRFRLFPQFTLQELMIVMTLVAIISSAIASAAFARL